MENLFSTVNKRKIDECLYEMEVHKGRNTGAGSVSFSIYQLIIRGLVGENNTLAKRVDDLKSEIDSLKSKYKLEESIKDTELKIEPR